MNLRPGETLDDGRTLADSSKNAPSRGRSDRARTTRDAELAKRPRWLVFNKIDLIAEEDRDARLKDCVKRLRWGRKPWFAVSAATSEGCDEVVKKAMAFIEAEKRDAADAGA